MIRFWHRTRIFSFLMLAGMTTLRAEDRQTVEDTTREAGGSKSLVSGETLVPGPFEPAYQSLKNYNCPQWYKDAKFGIWAHWGPQGVPGVGDWYARNMYVEGSGTYKHHLELYGHPSKFGFKDVIQLWKAEKFDPDRLISLYKAAGAKYFVSMGCHHDNFDLWNSKYHRWNAVNMGPHKDIVGLWREAALKHGLRFGVSEHMAPSFKWFSVAHHADTNGLLAGVPYDGNNPANYDLYGPKPQKIWSSGAELWQESGMPDSWKLEWFRRCNDLLESYRPDYVYSDYGNVPFRREVGWQLLANYYNRNISDHGGRLEAVYTGKGDQERVYVRDFESGCAGDIQPETWQMDACIGNFYYDSRLKVRPASTVIRLLADVVSKNGNLLLSIPQKPDGTLDAQTETFLAEMTEWMKINSESIFGTAPFKIYGEGPTRIEDFRQRELSYTPKDIRFTVKGNTLYAIILGVPGSEVTITSLATDSSLVNGEISRIEVLGQSGPPTWSRDDDGLKIKLPSGGAGKTAIVLKITGLDDLAYDELLYPAMNGEFHLDVASAERHGSRFSVVTGKGLSHMSGWVKKEDWLSWKVKIRRPGTYDVSVISSAAGGASEMMITAGSETMIGKFPKTGNWEDYQTVSIGQLKVKDSGAVTISFRPGASWRPINLSTLILRPVESNGVPIGNEPAARPVESSAAVVNPAVIKPASTGVLRLPAPTKEGFMFEQDAGSKLAWRAIVKPGVYNVIIHYSVSGSAPAMHLDCSDGRYLQIQLFQGAVTKGGTGGSPLSHSFGPLEFSTGGEVDFLLTRIDVSGAGNVSVTAVELRPIGGTRASVGKDSRMSETKPRICINPVDGAEMVWIPEGDFIMGGLDGNSHTVSLKGYWIYKFPVTVSQYRQFCRRSGREMPTPPKWGWIDDHPMVNVSWYDSLAYAKWAGVRLPSEAEWEKAARGTDGRVLPWGNDFDTSDCQSPRELHGFQGTVPVGYFPGNVSPYGVFDMAGNIWEWCSSRIAPYPYRADDGREDVETYIENERRTYRGGGFVLNSWRMDWTILHRGNFYPKHMENGQLVEQKSDAKGFRCAASEVHNN